MKFTLIALVAVTLVNSTKLKANQQPVNYKFIEIPEYAMTHKEDDELP